MIHATIAFLFTLIAIYCICGTDEQTGERLTCFNSDDCFEKPRVWHIITQMHSNAHFLVDFIYSVVGVARHNATDYQMYAHHLLALASGLVTLHFMNFSVVFGVMLLFMEISTPFVSGRWLLYTHGYGHHIITQIDCALIFWTFLLGRLWFQFVVTFR